MRSRRIYENPKSAERLKQCAGIVSRRSLMVKSGIWNSLPYVSRSVPWSERVRSLPSLSLMVPSWVSFVFTLLRSITGAGLPSSSTEDRSVKDSERAAGVNSGEADEDDPFEAKFDSSDLPMAVNCTSFLRGRAADAMIFLCR